jgi:ribosomal protein L35
MRHILTKKSSRLKRHLRKTTTVSASDARRVRAMLNL